MIPLEQPGSLTRCTILGAQVPVAQSKILPLGRKGTRQDQCPTVCPQRHLRDQSRELQATAQVLGEGSWGERQRTGQGEGGRDEGAEEEGRQDGGEGRRGKGEDGEEGKGM